MRELSAFQKAIKNNKVKIVRRFLKEGELPDTLACVIAIQHKANDALKLLIRAGADVDKPEAYWGYTPLVRALKSGNLAAFRILSKAGASINKNCTSGPPLHYASGWGLLEGAKLCIAAGAAVEQRDSSGNTPLMLAASMGHIEIVKLLLKAGAKPRALNRADKTPCQLAAENNETEIVRLLSPVSQRPPRSSEALAL